ncbi:MAG TPA: alkaline phosphatase D family protein [Ramlibacter sp.]|jgi:alkaline phosphatase D
MTHRTLDPGRRAVLGALAAAGALGALPAFAAIQPPRFRADPFVLGVASGSPAPEGFVLWTRLVDSGIDPALGVAVRWEVFEDGSPRTIVASGETEAVAALGHAVHVEVAGLKPDRWYGYRFMAGSAVSPVGRTRTLPAPDAVVNRLRFAYACCQKWESGYYAAYRHMAAEQLDLVLFLGDYIYEGASRGGVRPHALPTAQTLQDYRARYALHRSDPDLQRMHAACPWLVTWDDHEVENNYADLRSSIGTRNFGARRAAGYQAFYEHMPLRAATMVAGLQGLGAGRELRIYGQLNFGKLARINVLDDRQYRDTPLCREKQDGPFAQLCSQAPGDGRSLLGVAQEKWLAQSMGEAARQRIGWNFIAQQTVFTPRNYDQGPGRRFSQDSWDGYPTARERLLADLAAQKPANPILLGGDIHQNWVANVHARPYDVRSPIVASEFCGTSITSPSGVAPERAAALAKRTPHCLLSNVQDRGYGVIEVQPGQATVNLRVVDDVTNRDSKAATLATFVVENGRPQIQRA